MAQKVQTVQGEQVSLKLGIYRVFPNTLAEYTSGYIVGTYITSDSVERQSQDEKKHIVTKVVVGLLIEELS
jgi:hypothetical protein